MKLKEKWAEIAAKANTGYTLDEQMAYREGYLTGLQKAKITAASAFKSLNNEQGMAMYEHLMSMGEQELNEDL